jgi:hypothetical protein
MCSSRGFVATTLWLQRTNEPSLSDKVGFHFNRQNHNPRPKQIKHGRTAMLAFLGIVVPSSLGFYVPSYPEEPDFIAVRFWSFFFLNDGQVYLYMHVYCGHGGDERPR